VIFVGTVSKTALFADSTGYSTRWFGFLPSIELRVARLCGGWRMAGGIMNAKSKNLKGVKNISLR
jgi:hypothetical protein